ncbi:fibropellin-1, partial [Aplysia californica]|uniref:Fibropellin-1 n=1 Tax=Aplysia californica TaxID=6500 RepID=A0ABM1W4P9_APLCA
METLDRLKQLTSIVPCASSEIVGVECQASSPGASGGGLMCSDSGALCENSMQASGQCDNYRVRYLCGIPAARNQVCKSINFCDPDPCENGAPCTDTGGGFLCSCRDGFSGHRCQHDINDCEPGPCKNGGNCTDLLNNFLCDCSGTGFDGPTCERDINECDSDPCNITRSRACQNLTNDFSCDCLPGYTGKACEEEVNECASAPCLHGAVCNDRQADFHCVCPNGWSGKTCEIEDKLCSDLGEPCDNAAQCLDLFNSYYCRCLPNTYGTNCSDSLDVCLVDILYV